MKMTSHSLFNKYRSLARHINRSCKTVVLLFDAIDRNLKSKGGNRLIKLILSLKTDLFLISVQTIIYFDYFFHFFFFILKNFLLKVK